MLHVHTCCYRFQVGTDLYVCRQQVAAIKWAWYNGKYLHYSYHEFTREMSVQELGNSYDVGREVLSEMKFGDEESPLLSKTKLKTFDDALETPGVGFFHIVLILVSGWALASDSVEVQCVSFVTPLLNDSNANPDLALRASDVSYY